MTLKFLLFVTIVTFVKLSRCTDLSGWYKIQNVGNKLYLTGHNTTGITTLENATTKYFIVQDFIQVWRIVKGSYVSHNGSQYIILIGTYTASTSEKILYGGIPIVGNSSFVKWSFESDDRDGWLIKTVEVGPNGTEHLCLASHGLEPGKHPKLQECSHDKSNKWKLKKLAYTEDPDHSGLFLIQNAVNGQYMTKNLSMSGRTYLQTLHPKPDKENISQKWSFVKLKHHCYGCYAMSLRTKYIDDDDSDDDNLLRKPVTVELLSVGTGNWHIINHQLQQCYFFSQNTNTVKYMPCNSKEESQIWFLIQLKYQNGEWNCKAISQSVQVLAIKLNIMLLFFLSISHVY